MHLITQMIHPDLVSISGNVLQRQEKTMGQSIQRETFMLKKVAADLVATNAP